MTNNPGSNNIIREFKPSSVSVDNRTSIFVLAFLILLIGLVSYNDMARENFPEIVIPTIYVGTTYSGNSPSDMENLITRPIEKEINTVTGIKKISSTSIQDHSTIVVEFNPDVAVTKALQDVKDAVDRAKTELPSDLDKDPNIFEMNFSEFPIMNINLAGNFAMDELEDYAEFLKDEIEKLPEISEVKIKGALKKEVQIDLDAFQMEARKISFQDVENAIRSENVTISGGDLLADEFRRTLRVVGEFKNMEEIEEVIVKHDYGQIVFLRDIARVAFDFEEPKSYARSAGLPVVSLDVKKRSGENLINGAAKIKEILERAKERKFPKNLEITITNDQSKQTAEQVENLENSIISGMTLVVLVLLFFMGLRNALFVGIAIPLSMLTGFMILHFFNVTLNTMVLFSLILALGMLVDNGIVVVENIYRLMQEGYGSLRAAKEGVGEVAVPIIASTATTLAAFFPLLFWGDIMGEFMKYLPITLIIVLSSSLFVALIINPVLTSVFMKVDSGKKKPPYKRAGILIVLFLLIALFAWLAGSSTFRNLGFFLALITLVNLLVLRPGAYWFQNKLLPKIELLYHHTITYALKGSKPYLFLLGTVFLLIGSFILLTVRAPKINFFPINEPAYINIFVEMPLGTDIEKTNSYTRIVEKEVDKAIQPYRQIVESVIVNIGEGTTDPMEGSPSRGVTPHRARITVAFHEFQLRDGLSTADVLEDIREAVNDLPGAKITVSKNNIGPPVGKPISIEIIGEDYATLTKLGNEVIREINNLAIPGIEELKSDLETGKPELIIEVDRTASRRYGVSSATIAQTIRTALFGKEISKFKSGEDDYPIIIRFNPDQRYDLETILNQPITFRDQSSGGKLVQVPIASVATVRYTSSFGSIKRKNLNRVITIGSNVNEGYNATEIVNKIRASMENYELPQGYELRFTGEQEEQAKSMAFLSRALFIAVGLIFLIIVTQFNSLVRPFIIMLSVLFSTIGVFLGLAVFKMDFIVIMTMIGIISLAGIVVNNAIVLMDYIDLVRKRRRAELGLEGRRLSYEDIVQSIIIGGKTRLRPVLLTAITTVLGLIPLAIGLNINFFTLLSDLDPDIYIGGDNVVFWGPMSWTVIFGLTFSTFLTLVIVPVMYLISDLLKFRLSRMMGRTAS